MPRFFIQKGRIRQKKVRLSKEDARHILRVLRLKEDDTIVLFDEEGNEYPGVIGTPRGEGLIVGVGPAKRVSRESPLDLVLVQALTKSNRMDFIVQKVSELGISSIYPFSGQRVIPKYDEQKAIKRVARWQRIALEATKQCGRTKPPVVHPICQFHEVVREFGDISSLKLILWEEETEMGLKEALRKEGTKRAIALIVGPEGGFSPEELQIAQGNGFLPISLGKRILRVETACLSAISLIQYEMGDLGMP